MNLQKLNLVELNAKELKETDGGFLPALAAAVAGYLVISSIEYPKEFVNSFKKGF
ncbi:bacteriocin [Elizabethkingia anophelis]|uniref:class IIb bacteriocin, lactobin A/cerein 7B family n=1 Tax=Elizabethkingia anophelis TaxID=1117645 RepID=UPI0029364159|nr:bacteriocin [Elizabethkingia anophelis]